MHLLAKCLYFSFFYIDMVTGDILKTVQNSVMCHHVCNRCFRYLGALPVCFLESLSCAKTRFVG